MSNPGEKSHPRGTPGTNNPHGRPKGSPNETKTCPSCGVPVANLPLHLRGCADDER